LTEEFDRVTISAILDPDPDKYSVLDAVKLLFMSFDLMMRDDYYMAHIFIIDVTNFTLGHAAKYTIPMWKKIEVCGLVSIQTLLNNNLFLFLIFSFADTET
jgi:hypothetical protein